jgi:hypothetical protein
VCDVWFVWLYLVQCSAFVIDCSSMWSVLGAGLLVDFGKVFGVVSEVVV